MRRSALPFAMSLLVAAAACGPQQVVVTIEIDVAFAARGPDGSASAIEEMAHFLFELGVDGLFTNNPDLFPRTAPEEGS